uniref:Ovule protein n=1 Tax=Brugia timori TaxID=42155 RepID=A0A0R3R6J5_9BILA
MLIIKCIFRVSFLVWYALELLVEMLFYSFFKSLVGKDVVVELKNDLRVIMILHIALFLYLSKVTNYFGSL